MNMLPGGGVEPPTRDELRRVEARLDARLQEVNARLVLHDGRFAVMGDRINQAERRSDALAARIDSRLRTIDRRFDAVDSRLDTTDARVIDTRDQVLKGLAQNRRHSDKMTMLSMGCTMVATLTLGTFVVMV